MEKFAWLATFVGAVLGVLTLLVGLLATNSAVQEAAVFALAIAFAVIPYCFARACSEMARLKRDQP